MLMKLTTESIFKDYNSTMESTTETFTETSTTATTETTDATTEIPDTTTETTDTTTVITDTTTWITDTTTWISDTTTGITDTTTWITDTTTWITDTTTWISETTTGNTDTTTVNTDKTPDFSPDKATRAATDITNPEDDDESGIIITPVNYPPSKSKKKPKSKNPTEKYLPEDFKKMARKIKELEKQVNDKVSISSTFFARVFFY